MSTEVMSPWWRAITPVSWCSTPGPLRARIWRPRVRLPMARRSGRAVAAPALLGAEQARLQEVAVQARDHVERDALRAGGFALAVVGAAAEAGGVHRGDHPSDAQQAFGLSLGQQRELSDLGSREEHGR